MGYTGTGTSRRESMEPGKDWSSRWPGCGRPAFAWLGLLLWLVAGCAADRAHVDKALMADKGTANRNQGVVECYTVHCPDVLQIAFAERPGLSGPCPVGSDGRIDATFVGWPSQADPTYQGSASLSKTVGLGRPTYGI